MSRNIKIQEFEISKNSKTFIVGEISANHNGKIENAIKLIEEAKKAGVDAIKLQTYTPDTITLNCSNEYFQIKQGTLWDGRTLYDLYKEAFMPWEWQPKLKKIAEDEGLICFSSPFDKTSVDFLESMNVPAYKIASFEITDIPLIEYIASKGKPVIIATGISLISDIKEAIDACKKVGNDNIIILKCTSAYPSHLEDVNLRTIPNISETFGVIAGLSDHTTGIEVPIGAVALGAKVIEKHITLSRADGGADAAFSLEPHELGNMVKSIRNIEKALGDISYNLTEKQISSRELARSLFVAKDIKVGEKFTENNIKSVRPGFGLHPKYLKNILGKTSSTNLSQGTPMNWKYVGYGD